MKRPQFRLRDVLFGTAVIASFLGGWKLRDDVSRFENDQLWMDYEYKPMEKVWYYSRDGWATGEILDIRGGSVLLKTDDGIKIPLVTQYLMIRPAPNAIVGALVRRMSQ